MPDSNDAGTGADHASTPSSRRRATTRALRLPSPSPTTTRPRWTAGALVEGPMGASQRSAPLRRSNARMRGSGPPCHAATTTSSPFETGWPRTAPAWVAAHRP
ncbi:MAG TPA: hypothetical protein VF152_07375 [Acidimicrobiia bacterium]